jgi:hypothetical protein
MEGVQNLPPHQQQQFMREMENMQLKDSLRCADLDRSSLGMTKERRTNLERGSYFFLNLLHCLSIAYPSRTMRQSFSHSAPFFFVCRTQHVQQPCRALL